MVLGSVASIRADALASEASALLHRHREMGIASWCDILSEKVTEAFAENDPAALRTALTQCRTVIQGWIADIDARREAS
jgi:hypothetical protein